MANYLKQFVTKKGAAPQPDLQTSNDIEKGNPNPVAIRPKLDLSALSANIAAAKAAQKIDPKNVQNPPPVNLATLDPNYSPVKSNIGVTSNSKGGVLNLLKVSNNIIERIEDDKKSV